VGTDAGPDSEELARLRAELRSCRLELAQRHREIELLEEERHEVLRRSEAAEEQARLLATFLDERLVSDAVEPSSTGPTSRLRRRAGLPAKTGEDADVAALQASGLLDGPWYLRQHPHVVATGLSPAAHYLRHGAAAGLDPGPDFRTEDYLRRHPEVAASAENPLLHHLRHEQRGDHDRQDDPLAAR
jgi:hypothetical protein